MGQRAGKLLDTKEFLNNLFAEDEYIAKLYEQLAKYWPKQVAKRGKAEATSGQKPDPEAAAKLEGEGVVEAEDGQDVSVSGESTPGTKEVTQEDEYLAWTLGGDLRQDTPLARLVKGDAGGCKAEQVEEQDIDRKLAELEQLVVNEKRPRETEGENG